MNICDVHVKTVKEGRIECEFCNEWFVVDCDCSIKCENCEEIQCKHCSKSANTCFKCYCEKKNLEDIEFDGQNNIDIETLGKLEPDVVIYYNKVYNIESKCQSV